MHTHAHTLSHTHTQILLCSVCVVCVCSRLMHPLQSLRPHRARSLPLHPGTLLTHADHTYIPHLLMKFLPPHLASCARGMHTCMARTRTHTHTLRVRRHILSWLPTQPLPWLHFFSSRAYPPSPPPPPFHHQSPLPPPAATTPQINTFCATQNTCLALGNLSQKKRTVFSPKILRFSCVEGHCFLCNQACVNI